MLLLDKMGYYLYLCHSPYFNAFSNDTGCIKSPQNTRMQQSPGGRVSPSGPWTKSNCEKKMIKIGVISDLVARAFTNEYTPYMTKIRIISCV